MQTVVLFVIAQHGGQEIQQPKPFHKPIAFTFCHGRFNVIHWTEIFSIEVTVYLSTCVYKC